MEAIQRGDLFFTAAPGAAVELPQPFRVAGRLARLVEADRPTVAVLGFGLGAVADLLLADRPRMRLVGVEPDRDLLASVPERLLRRVTLRRADALGFLRATRFRFDLVFDDCFVLADGDAVRPPELQRHAGLVADRLVAGGIYVRNLLPDGASSVVDQCVDLRRRFRWVQLRRFRDWENVFAVASDHEFPADWRARLRSPGSSVR